MEIALDQIKINKRMREIDPAKVQSLAESIKEIGLINPITISKDHVLIAGMHRLEAMKLLKKTHIECNISETPIFIDKLKEIDENLVRSELTLIERGDFLRERKRICIENGLCSKNGDNQYNTKNNELRGLPLDGKAQEKTKTFAELTRDSTGFSISKINNDMDSTKKLDAKIKPILNDMLKKKEVTETEVAKINKMTPEKQIKVIEKKKNGEAKKIGEASAQVEREIKLAEIKQNPKPQLYQPLISLQHFEAFLPTIKNESQDAIYQTKNGRKS